MRAIGINQAGVHHDEGLDNTLRHTFILQPSRAGGGQIQFPIRSYKRFSRRLALQDFNRSWKRSVQAPRDEKSRAIWLPVRQVPFVIGHDAFVTRRRQARRPVPSVRDASSRLSRPRGFRQVQAG